jgi:hypothetical protein
MTNEKKKVLDLLEKSLKKEKLSASDVNKAMVLFFGHFADAAQVARKLEMGTDKKDLTEDQRRITYHSFPQDLFFIQNTVKQPLYFPKNLSWVNSLLENNFIGPESKSPNKLEWWQGALNFFMSKCNPEKAALVKKFFEEQLAELFANEDFQYMQRKQSTAHIEASSSKFIVFNPILSEDKENHNNVTYVKEYDGLSEACRALEMRLLNIIIEKSPIRTVDVYREIDLFSRDKNVINIKTPGLTRVRDWIVEFITDPNVYGSFAIPESPKGSTEEGEMFDIDSPTHSATEDHAVKRKHLKQDISEEQKKTLEQLIEYLIDFRVKNTKTNSAKM